MTYEILRNHTDYEILNEYPFTIRRRRDGYIISEWFNAYGYVIIKLNSANYKKHRIIAEQFISNPLNLPQVDHINHNRADNRIENLRWVSHQDNCRNKSKHNGVEYIFIDKLIENESFEITNYGEHVFENYYYNLMDEQFYLKTNDNMFRRLHINNDRGYKFVMMKNIDNKQCKININLFRKLYDLL